MNKNIGYHFLALLATILVAGSFLAGEKLTAIINPLSLTLLRFLGASLILFPIVMSKLRWRQKIISTLPRGMIISLFLTSFYFCFFEALKTTTPLNTGVLFTLIPFIISLLSLAIFKINVTTKQIFIYILGFIGTCWVIFGGQLQLLMSFSLNKGDLIFLLAVLAMCFYGITTKLLSKSSDEMVVITFCSLLGGTFWISLVLFFANIPLEWHLIKSDSMLQMAYLILGPTLGTAYLYQKTIPVLGPNQVGAYTYLNPALVAILLFLIEKIAIPKTVMPGVLISIVATIVLLKSHTQTITTYRSDAVEKAA